MPARNRRLASRTAKPASFDYSLDFKNIDFRQHPECYRIGKGEQGVLLVEPYKSEILPHWKFKTAQEAKKSSAKIYRMFLAYLKANDFPGADMARKFLQMGWTRARRYANHKGGRVVPANADATGHAKADRGAPQRQEEGRPGGGGLAEVLRGREGISGKRMSRLDAVPEIIDLAVELGVGAAAPVNGILAYCRCRIDGWVAEAGGVTGIDALESLVTQRLQMVFEEVRTDEDFDRITEVYARGKKEFVFAGMRSKFDDADNPTFGALVQRRRAGPADLDRFVALIDCRGQKLARRFFTRWHEIAHRLTTHADMQEPVYRSEHDPIERMMDEIAGHVGFYSPLFDPVFQRANEGKPLLTLGTVQAILSGAFPADSFQATLFACTRRLPTPVIYLVAALAHKKEVKRRLATPSLFGDDAPPGELRAVKVIPNKAAQQDGFTIPPNMRVPTASVIHRLFDADQTDGDGNENMSQWESKGKPLAGRAVVVEARKVSDRVIAIVQPVEAKQGKRDRSQGQSLFSDGEERTA